jgi:pentatricopeptide repeat domain-containing protein 1
VLNSCVKSNELALALEVFQRMLAEGLTPNIVTYNILLEVSGRGGGGSFRKVVGVLLRGTTIQA